jgi:hypothetical protein
MDGLQTSHYSINIKRLNGIKNIKEAMGTVLDFVTLSRNGELGTVRAILHKTDFVPK